MDQFNLLSKKVMANAKLENYELYNGEVLLLFDPDKHIYTVDNEVAYGVTSITNVINKPALMYWGIGVAVDKFLELVEAGISYDEIQLQEFAEKMKYAHRNISKTATTVGKQAHEHMEQIINAIINDEKLPPKPVSKELQKTRVAFAQWVKEHDVKFIEAERKVYSKKHKYAGTLDILAEIDGELSVIDIKTSSGIYSEYYFQNSAYCKAVEEELGKEVKHSLILRVDKETGQFEIGENGDIDEAFEVFLACHTIYKFQMLQKDKNGGN